MIYGMCEISPSAFEVFGICRKICSCGFVIYGICEIPVGLRFLGSVRSIPGSLRFLGSVPGCLRFLGSVRSPCLRFLGFP